ncbi:MAG: preprotein translocase subunit SecG [Bacteroidales bacterium]|nr:preprotein translocase subunit SecG [Bacteroidales bacterium]
MGGYIIVSALVLITCVLLVLIILVQNPKGGGLSSAFGGSSSSNQIMGVKRTTDFLEKATWALAIILLVLSLSSVFVIPRNQPQETTVSESQEFYQDNPDASINYNTGQNQLPVQQEGSGQQEPVQPE